MAIDLLRRDSFADRHIGLSETDVKQMVSELNSASLAEFTESVIPSAIRTNQEMNLPVPMTEEELLEYAAQVAEKNKVFRSFIGMGYYDTFTPGVIARNILENPSWYTQYTPYQAEISQGRLEALLNFQTMIVDLTGLPIANASLLDEATAAAEAMGMIFALKKQQRDGVFLVSEECHPQTVAVIQTRAKALGIEIVIGKHTSWFFNERVLGCFIQYPTTDGGIHDYKELCLQAHAAGSYVAVAADLLALTLLTPPGEFGADIAVGSSQRFGVPMGYGGPHAAFISCSETFKRVLPGRIIGVSIDADGNRALRMALQTREQHIRREKATSNICTAQVLLAIMASMYAIYHGPGGLQKIARKIHDQIKVLAHVAKKKGWKLYHDDFFDTLRIRHEGIPSDAVRRIAELEQVNFRYYADDSIGISFDERTTTEEIKKVFQLLTAEQEAGPHIENAARELRSGYEGICVRHSEFLKHPVFNSYHTEHEILRYIKNLEAKDLSLVHGMIPLGSCTMKLNGTAEMIPISWRQFSGLHPFVPPSQAEGYKVILDELQNALLEVTGFKAVSFQPNSGAQGEYAGLLVIRAYHSSKGEHQRTVCLIPSSAHGTNPASAVMSGLTVVVVGCNEDGNVDMDDLRAKITEHASSLAAIMITYPSTHGVFEESIREMCDLVHQHGGLVYMDGANLNAQVGQSKPAELGADVCHINLHKTFCIPHGGGGPGMGPIAVSEHLATFLPGHPVLKGVGGKRGIGAVSAAPFGSANILLISWAYIRLMGAQGLKKATQVAILSANYMSYRLSEFFKTLYKGPNGRVAHEFIIDLRNFKESAGIEAEDVAKRLMDYGLHAPTLSFPVAGTLMIEPTESESKRELDRYCEALISIRKEISEIESGSADRTNNVLKNAPHTVKNLGSDVWDHPYTREKAGYPIPALYERKFFPTVARVNNAFGDRNLVCACPPIEAYDKN